MRSIRWLPILVLAFVTVPALAADAAATKPVEQLETAVRALLLEGDGPSFLQRYKRLAPIVKKTHDFDRMAASRVGAAWSTLDARKKKSLKNLLFKRVVAAYAARFDGTKEMALERTPAKDAAGGADVELKDGAERLYLFRTTSSPEGWRIADVAWRGQPTAEAERAESARTLAGASGFAGLEASWKKKVVIPGQAPKAAEPEVPDRTPRQVIEHVQATILQTMKDAKTLGFQGRFDKFAPLVDETHHMPTIARVMLGRNWSKITGAQQKTFVEKFRRFSVARYANRFDGFAGETFTVEGEKKAGASTIVTSVLKEGGGKPHDFVWTLRKVGDRWRILNITADGVSDLATKKREYADIFRSRGIQGVLDVLERQTRRQESGG